jgi:DNA-binding transcriptional MerR regulator
MTGIPRNTLIAWERRYGVVHPTRHENGYRSYSDEDVARLLRLKNAQAAGLSISEAVTLLDQEGATPSPPDPPPAQRAGPDATQAFGGLCAALCHALVHYQRAKAEEILGGLLGVPFKTRLREVYFPVLREIGDLWERRTISIVQEHYATSLLRTHFASILVGIGTSNPRATHAACTTFVGDLHEMGALALAIQLSLDGYRVSYLGPNLPADELVRFVHAQKPKLLCVSVVMPTTARALRAYAAEVAPALPSRGLLVLGGKVLERLQDALDLPGVCVQPEWGTDFALR